MKKKSVGDVFMRKFISSLIFVSIFVLLAFGSYKLSFHYYMNYGNLEATESLTKYFQDLNADGLAENVSKNLILGVDAESEKVNRIVIEIVNKDAKSINYITVPSNMEYTMSYELYKKLATVNNEIPQIIRLNQVHKYFKAENLCQCIQLLLEDALDIKMSYYTKINMEVYKEMFAMDKTNGIQKWTTSYENEMIALKSKEEYEVFFDKYYDKVSTNLARKDKDLYIDTYLECVPEMVFYSIVCGEKMDSSFVVAVEETNSMLNKIINSQGGENSQYVDDGKGTSSVGMNIVVLNSTKINGLASAYQDKLESEGFNITRIGNYGGKVLQQTKIVVSEESCGQDLLNYFNDACVEVGNLEQGVDIFIILGENDGDING